MLVTSSKDTALRSLREADRWEAVVRSLPLVAHWLDGTPIDDGVQVMARLEDRYRGFVVDGTPVATGVVAVADSWACSNPANGRGASIGMLHALTLRDQLRAVGLDDPAAFAEAFHAGHRRERRAVVPRDPGHRPAPAGRDRGGHPRRRPTTRRTPGTSWRRRLTPPSGRDPDCLRAALDIRFVLQTPDEVFARPGLRDKTLAAGGGLARRSRRSARPASSFSRWCLRRNLIDA